MTVKPRRPMDAGQVPGSKLGTWPEPRNLRVARKVSRRPLSTCGSHSPWSPHSIAISTGWRDRRVSRPTAG